MFSYDALAGFLKEARGFAPVFPLRDFAGQPGIIMRHDVDLDIVPAHRLAQVEKEAGVRASFFFLMSSDTYNPASAANRALLREMSQEGFEIALHFDPTLYPEADHDGLERHARTEADQLAQICQSDVVSLSLHNPDHYGRMPLFESFINAYDPKVFASGRYSSDSRMVFRTDPKSLFALARTQVTQINLHPEHYSADGGPYPGPMVDYIDRMIGEVHRTFRVNNTYVEATTEGLHHHVGAFLQRRAPE